MKELDKKKILVAPLNWGLGHATRCIPIINALIKVGFVPVIASDGEALLLLQKEFPKIKSFELPSYNITYPKNSKFFLIHFLLKIPHFFKTLKAENTVIQKIVKAEKIKGIISDNRFGCYHSNIKSVYITHQLKVSSGFWTPITSKIHQNIIQNFDVCWIPDDDKNTFSGKLSQTNNKAIKTLNIGILSRFKRTQKIVSETYDYLLLLSGPEPQRSLLEELLLMTFKDSSQRILIVQGKVEKVQKKSFYRGIERINFMTQNELQKTILQSNIVIARSGYSTLMDLSALSKKAFFIPTPGQTEQLYLAKRLRQNSIAPYALQQQFKLADLKEVENYKGFVNMNAGNQNLEEILNIFK